ncbi:phenylacetate--CoA ligase family protein [Micromonospora sp. DT233]|uniref:phenylacetate--CoA ligase family protein n=1 Tax=Micromonospora sp. DT233 TaxID=3393432 RepID=UPI003CE85AF7
MKAFDEAHQERLELAAAGFAADLVRERQREKLDRLWDRLADVPYYRHRSWAQERSLDGAPVTPKAALKNAPEEFLRSGVGPYYRYYETSGSTGVPTPTPRLAMDMVWNTASVSALWALSMRPGDRVASLLPSDVVPVGDLVATASEYLGCTLLRCYPFSQGITDWDRLEALFDRFRPEHVFAAPGVLLQWTRILKKRGRLDDVRSSVRSLMLLGEVSTSALRARLAEQWQAEALDVSYGSTETGTIAASCPLDRLHLLAHGFAAEILEDGRLWAAEPGRSGELVVTTLNNYARPLVRYSTGDLVSVGDCPCGLGLPVLTVHGRAADQIVVAGVEISAGQVEDVVYGTAGVTGYLVQLKRSDPTAARLVLERDVDFSQSTDAVCASVSERFAAGLGVQLTQVVMVDQLPQTTKAGGSQKNWKRTNVQWVD